MICPNCGANNAPGAKFCVGCGANIAAVPQQSAQQYTQQQNVQQNVQQPIPAAKPKKAAVDFGAVKNQLAGVGSSIVSKIKPILSNKKILAGIVGGVAVLLILVIVCAILGGGNGFNEVKTTIFVEQTGKNEYSVIVNKKVLSTTIESEGGSPDLFTSADGSKAAILTSEGELYVVTGKKLKEVADDVKSCDISLNGKYLAYTTKAEDEDAITLHHCKVSNAKSEEISDEIAGISEFAIAPNGKSVAYFVAGEEDEPDELMYFNGKKSEKIGDDGGILYGMSNSGKEIYVGIGEKVEIDEEEIDEEDYEDYEDLIGGGSKWEYSMYAYNKKGERTNLGTYNTDYDPCFNDDHRQIMFFSEDNKTYIASKGKKPDGKAASDLLELLIPSNSGTHESSVTDAYTYPVSNLYNQVYQTSGSAVWLIKKNAEKNVKLVSKASRVQIDASAEYVYYNYDGEELRCIKISHGEKASEKYKTILEDHAPSIYYVTSDRKYVYYIEDDSVYSVNGKKGGIPKEIAEDLESYITVSGKDVMYYIVDGDLYACSNGKKGKKVASDVNYVATAPTGYTYAFGEDALYGTTGAKKPKKLVDIDL